MRRSFKFLGDVPVNVTSHAIVDTLRIGYQLRTVQTDGALMGKRVHYNGASTLIKANPEGGGKVRRTKLGALQIAVMNWNSIGAYLPQSWARPVEEASDVKPKPKAPKKPKVPRKPKLSKAERQEAQRAKVAKANRRHRAGKIQSWSAD